MLNVENTTGTDRASFSYAGMMEVFIVLALKAGAEILDVRKKGIETTLKNDNSPVTEADRRAEEIIFGGLCEHYPDIPVVAEEEVAAGRCPDVVSDRFILVDPLDGTREFVAGRPDFTVNIALIEKGAPVAGIVYVPMRGELYGGTGDAAWMQETGPDGKAAPRRKIACRKTADAPVIVASKSHLTPQTSAFIARFPGAETVSVGSSLKFCLVAAGKADLYPRYGRTMEWDTAAGDAILRAAGGATLTPEGSPMLYGKRHQAHDVDYANSDFIAASASGLELIHS